MAFSKLFVYLIHEIILVHLIHIKFPDVTLFCLLYEVVKPAVIGDRLGWVIDHQDITLHFGLMGGYEQVLELFYWVRVDYLHEGVRCPRVVLPI